MVDNIEAKAKRMADDLKKADKARADEAAEAAKDQADFGPKVLDLLGVLADRLTALEATQKRGEAQADEEETGNDDTGTEVGPDGKNRKKNTPAPMTYADALEVERKESAAKAHVQSRVDNVAAAHGQRADAPMSGETVDNYRRRLLQKHQHHSAEFGEVNIASLSGTMLDAVENKIYADSLEASKSPFVPANELIERVTTDEAGRRIRTFYGRPSAWMAQFSGTSRRLTGINTKPDRY